MAMKQNLQQEVAASLMEEKQILEDQQFGGSFDDDWKDYRDYCEKLEEEKRERELEAAMREDDICDWDQLIDTICAEAKEAVQRGFVHNRGAKW